MDTAAFVRALTLWFVVLIFLQTGSGGDAGPIVTGIVLFAVVLVFAIPQYVFIAALRGTGRFLMVEPLAFRCRLTYRNSNGSRHE